MSYYDRKGNPVDMMQWATSFEDKDRIIKQEQVGVYWISTVFLGLDHRFSSGPPLIFETMVFRGRESDLDCERYSTEEEAIVGHEAMVEKWAKMQPNLFERFVLYFKDIDENLQRQKMLRDWRKKKNGA